MAVWLLTRVAMLLLTACYFQGDCATYFREGRLWLDGQVPYRDYSVEYPPAAAAVFALLALAGNTARFRVVFIIVTLLLDAACLILLLRGRAPATGELGGTAGESGKTPSTHDASARSAALTFVLSTAPLFPVLYVRFDLMPATACLAALLAIRRTTSPLGAPSAAAVGAMFGLGIALKLYPLLLTPMLVLHWRRTGMGLCSGLVAAATGALVVAASFVPPLLAGAGGAIFSFVAYQSERGLQLESSYAGLLMLADQVMPFGLIHRASHSAHDVAGPGVAIVTVIAKCLQPVAVALVTAVAHRRRVSLLPACGAVLTAAILTGNVFSPQFLVWMLPLAACASTRPFDHVLFYLVGTSALTSLIFPVLYPRLIDGELSALATLLARNVLLALVLVRLTRKPASAPL